MLFIDSLGNSLDFDIVGYEFEEKNSNNFDWDANWLTVKLVYNKDDCKQEFYSSCILTTELKDFVTNLEKLKNGENDNCELNALEPYLKMGVKKDKDNYIFNIEFIYNRSTGEKLTFTSNLSKTEFDYIFKEMKELSEKYKVR